MEDQSKPVMGGRDLPNHRPTTFATEVGGTDEGLRFYDGLKAYRFPSPAPM